MIKMLLQPSPLKSHSLDSYSRSYFLHNSYNLYTIVIGESRHELN